MRATMSVDGEPRITMLIKFRASKSDLIDAVSMALDAEVPIKTRAAAIKEVRRAFGFCGDGGLQITAEDVPTKYKLKAKALIEELFPDLCTQHSQS